METQCLMSITANESYNKWAPFATH